MTTPNQIPPSLEDTVRAAFTERYDVLPSHIARAPGRINIIGEHTDYSDGFVLPAAIDRAICVAGRLRQDNQVHIQSLDFDDSTSFRLDQIHDPELPAWSKYPRGVLWMLGQRGNKLHGMDLTIAGNVPLGAGLSSSAAVEVAMFEIGCALLGISLTQREKALLGVEVEHKFIGIPCGVMDQMISALGQEDHALLIDCRSLEATPIPIPHNVSLLILDTNKRRELVHSEYGKRRAEVETATKLLGAKSLRDVQVEDFPAALDLLPAALPQFARRALHVVSENARTLAMAEALKSGDLVHAGQLINEGHASLRDLFQVSIPELDVMATLAQRERGCYGARMMGGGFGGAVIALVDQTEASRIADSVSRGYYATTGLKARVYVAKAGSGSGSVKVS